MHIKNAPAHRRSRPVRRDLFALDASTRGLPRQAHAPARSAGRATSSQHPLRPSTTSGPLSSLKRALQKAS